MGHEIATSYPSIKPKEANHFSENKELSEDQMGELVSAVGTNEAKCLILIDMAQHPNKASTAYYINKSLYAAQDLPFDEPKKFDQGWAIRSQAVENYCTKSFMPVGLVKKNSENTSGHNQFVITKFGERNGVPLAGFLLEYSTKYQIPLRNIFGEPYSSAPNREIGTPDLKDITQSRKRSPLTRIKIFQSLLKEQENVTEADLRKLVGEQDHKLFSRHINALIESDIISHIKIDGEKKLALSQSQREAIEELIEGLDKLRISNPDIMQKSAAFASQFLSSSKNVREAMERAKKSSSLAQRVPQEEIISSMKSIITSDPNIPTDEIRKRLKSGFGINLTLDRVRELLLQQYRNGKFHREVRDKSYVWREN